VVRFNFKKLNEVEYKEQYSVEYQIGSMLCKIWMLRWILTVFGKLLEVLKF
jgi:hypothetical protein